MDISDRDRDLAIRTIMGEVDAGDSDASRAAVASVILNRARSGQYGKSVSNVVLSQGQFEPWSTRRRELQGYSARSSDYQHAGDIFDAVASGAISDPTGGATHFYSPGSQRALGRAAPSWAREYPSAGQIGGHQFFYGPGSPQASAGAPGDLLGSWPTAPAATAPSAPAVAAQGAPTVPADDLLGSWPSALSGTPATAAGETPPAVRNGRIVITPAGTPEPPAPPTASQDQDVDLAKTLAEHQGIGFGDLAARLGIGALRGVKDVADTAAQGIAAVGRTGASALSGVGILSPETASSASDWAAGVNARIAAERDAWARAAADSPSAEVGRVGGQVAAAGPILRGAAALLPAVPAAVPPLGRALIGGAGYGGGAAALTSAASDQPLPEQVALGAGGGALAGPALYGLGVAGRGVSRALFGSIDPETANLAALARGVYDIPVTGGQIASNPIVRFADSVLQRMPFTGYGRRTVEQQEALNRAISNTFGEDTPKITMGTIQNARARIGRVFDDVANRTGPIAADPQFLGDLNRIATDARSVLPTSELTALHNQLRNIADTIDPHTGAIDPRSYQALTRKDAPLSRAQQSKDPNIKFYANQMREALDDVMQRSAPPDVVDDLIDARRQWKALKTVEPLAKKATTGDISPALLLGKVNQSYSGAGGNLGELGRIGQRFIKEPPSSGTSERLFAMELGKAVLGGALGLGGAYAFDPEHVQRDAGLGALALISGRLGSSALRSNALANSLIASGRGVSPLNAVPNLLRQTAPLAGVTTRRTLGLEPPRQ